MALMTHHVMATECRSEGEAMASARARFAGSSQARDAARARARRGAVASTVEQLVVPRLLLARRAIDASRPIGNEAVQPGANDVAELARLVIAHDEPVVVAHVEAVRDQGTSPESLYLDLLAPAARRLGEMWEEDLCDFTEVTIGLWRLQHVLRVLRPVFVAGVDPRGAGPRILLLPLPGEQHSFGLSMVFEFFCRAGWQASCATVASSGELATMVRREAFAVVGLSVASMDRLETVASEIRALRRASCNPGIGVMVGGPAFVAHPELAPLVGADATAVDGRHAVFQAQGLLTLLSGRR